MAKKKIKKTMPVMIKGVRYTVKVFEKVAYLKLLKDSLTHVDTEALEIIFREDHIKKNIIVHEVTHAFINSLGLGSCNDLSLEDFEEIICEMMEHHLMDINKLSNSILSFLKEAVKERT